MGIVCVGWKNMCTCFQTGDSDRFKKKRKNIIGKVDERTMLVLWKYLLEIEQTGVHEPIVTILR